MFYSLPRLALKTRHTREQNPGSLRAWKRALQTLLDKDGALSAIARDKTSGEVVGAAVSIVGRDGGRVIGPLLGTHEAALPLVHAVAPDGAATLRAIGGPTDILVETLTSAGFEVAVEQVSMSFGGHALPGKRELYLALMHPTLWLVSTTNYITTFYSPSST